MNDKVIFDLIRNSESPLTLVKTNGDIVFSSRVFDSVVADKLPYEGNLLEMLMHTVNIVPDIYTMFKNKKIDCSKLPQEIIIENNSSLRVLCNSTLIINNEELIMIELSQNSSIVDSFTENFIKSETLFIKKNKASLVYESINEKVIAINNATIDFIKDDDLEGNKLPTNLYLKVKEIVSSAKIGGISSNTYDINISNNIVSMKFECCRIDTNHNYYLVSFTDETTNKRKDEILFLDKNRAHNIIDVVPGILFEFEITDSELHFTYISESVKNLIGISAKHILNDSKKLFSYLNKHERARLHYFFTSLSEEERKIRNEFKIIDHENNTKWITINWHETYSDEGNIKGTGYIDDITEKKKIQIQKREISKRKELKNYFSISLLKQSSTSLLLKDLAETVVTKLRLQDLIIYIYNPDSKKLEYATSYSSINSEGARTTYPKEISSEKGIIGRVVGSQKSEIINYSSDDTDYYYIDKPSESEITVPIVFEGELLGIIDSEHISPNFFTSEHIYLLEDIAETLAIRLVQKKRQDDNLKFHSTLSLLYSQGKIFDFNFNLKTKKFNDSCIDNLIYLIGIKDTSKKIEIYNDSKILLDYIFQYDINLLTNIEESLELSVVETKEITFRIITETGFIKWLKLIISKVEKDKSNNISNIDGTIQDVTRIKQLETKSESFENIQSSIKISEKQLKENGDILKSLDLIGNTSNLAKIIISKLHIDGKQKLVNYLEWNNSTSKEGDFSIELVDVEGSLKTSPLIELLNIEKYSKNKRLKSAICIPLKTNKGLWGTITFLDSRNKWKDYEKNLMIVYSNLISIHLEKQDANK